MELEATRDGTSCLHRQIYVRHLLNHHALPHLQRGNFCLLVFDPVYACICVNIYTHAYVATEESTREKERVFKEVLQKTVKIKRAVRKASAREGRRMRLIKKSMHTWANF